MNNINWAPIIGIVLAVVGIVAVAFPSLGITGGSALIGMGLGVLGIHSTTTKLGQKLGVKN